MAVYIAIRLEWKMAIGALVAVAHDILISVGVYSLFQFEVTPATVIAFLTIMGYSLYDTIVVFDKTHEITGRLSGTGRYTYTEMMNLSLNQVLMRSINTSITSVLPVLSMLVIGSFVLGALTLQEFAIALLVGIVVGTYSSLFVASAVVTWMKEREPEHQAVTAKLAARGVGTDGTRAVTPEDAALGTVSPSASRPTADSPRSGAPPTSEEEKEEALTAVPWGDERGDERPDGPTAVAGTRGAGLSPNPASSTRTSLRCSPTPTGSRWRSRHWPSRGSGEVDVVVGVEARGFILGAPVARRLDLGFVPVRKQGKLPWETSSEAYGLEYGTDVLELHIDAVLPDQRVLVIDDVLATGGTAAATGRLVDHVGASLVGYGFLLELAFLDGRHQLAGTASNRCCSRSAEVATVTRVLPWRRSAGRPRRPRSPSCWPPTTSTTPRRRPT